MNKNISLVSAVLLLGLTSSRLPAQIPVETSADTLEVIAANGADEEKHVESIDGKVPTVMLSTTQVVPVTIQFSTEKAGMQLAAVPLDGGEIGGDDNLVVKPEGTAIFTFSPGAAPGRYRVMVYAPTEQHLLEFYVADPTRLPPPNPPPDPPNPPDSAPELPDSPDGNQ